MNWEAIAAFADFLAAIGVIASLIYVAQQVRASQTTAADTNRLRRTEGVCEMMHSFAVNDDLRNSLISSNKLEPAYERMASELDITYDEAARADFVSSYWFWLHWGQYSSTTDEADLEELRNVMKTYVDLPSLAYSWENSFVAKAALAPEFVDFVDKTTSEYKKTKI